MPRCAPPSPRRGPDAAPSSSRRAPEFYRGGNTRHTRNVRLAHDGSAPTMTGPYAQDEFLDDLYRVTGGQTDETLAKLTVARSAELLSWMDAQGVRFQPPLGGTLSLGKTNAFFLGGGRGALNALYRKAQSLGVAVVYDTPVTGLTIDNGIFMSAAVKHERPRRQYPRPRARRRRRRLRGQYRMAEEILGRGRRQFPHPRHAL